ncbi:hypothetical protein [Nocardioides alcanivorans]|uniref:hypothetical protein n=1 Tax=Nocardioides alcanivorans TaxID=2897352 RepID=UPI001F331A08|nr:hypothetical protein [Nocardioides alcanivorans]
MLGAECELVENPTGTRRLFLRGKEPMGRDLTVTESPVAAVQRTFAVFHPFAWMERADWPLFF